MFRSLSPTFKAATACTVQTRHDRTPCRASVRSNEAGRNLGCMAASLCPPPAQFA